MCVCVDVHSCICVYVHMHICTCVYVFVCKNSKRRDEIFFCLSFLLFFPPLCPCLCHLFPPPSLSVVPCLWPLLCRSTTLWVFLSLTPGAPLAQHPVSLLAQEYPLPRKPLQGDHMWLVRLGPDSGLAGRFLGWFLPSIPFEGGAFFRTRREPECAWWAEPLRWAKEYLS